MLFRPLPVRDPGRLVAILSASTTPDGPHGHLTYPGLRGPSRAARRPLGRLCLHAGGRRPQTGSGGTATRANGQIVTPNMFDVLGVGAFQGRTFADADDSELSVVISYDTWQRVFGADQAAVGRAVTINGRPFTIVGIAPRGFTGPDRFEPADLWIPLGAHQAVIPQDGNPLSRDNWWLSGIGRLAPGAERAASGDGARRRCGGNRRRGTRLAQGIHDQRREVPRHCGRHPRAGCTGRRPRHGSHALRSPHRLRQRCRPARLACRVTPARNRDPPRNRRDARSADPPVPRGKPRARRGGRRWRSDSRDVGHGSHRPFRRGAGSGRIHAGLARAAVHRARVPRRRGQLRSRSCAARRQPAAAPGIEVRAGLRRAAAEFASAARARHRSAGDVTRHARVGGHSHSRTLDRMDD